MIAQGAEAKIYLDEDRIIKQRLSKKYRLPELDDTIRRFRTRREAKVIQKLPEEVLSPKLLKADDKDMKIEMSHIQGKKIRDILDSNIELCTEIGEKIATMHNNGIIHGDLTTSNMIFSENKIYFIDFGLSFFSEKIEDKAVDLHLLKQALESKHHTISKKAFVLVIKGYEKHSHNFKEIKNRLEIVEARGRNKAK